MFVKRSYIIFFILGLFKIGIGQSENHFQELFWGDVQKTKSSVYSLSSTPQNETLCVQTSNALLRTLARNKTNFSFSLIQDHSIPKIKPIAFKGRTKKTRLFNYTYLGNSILGISVGNDRNVLSPSASLFYHILNPKEREKTNHGTPFFNFELKIKSNDMAKVDVISSSDANYATVFYIPKTSTKEFPLIKYAVFSSDFSAPIENEFLFPYSSSHFSPLEYSVLNESEQIMINGHFPYRTLPKGLNYPKLYYDFITITKIDGNEIKTEIFNSAGLQFSNVKIFEENREIIISGIYVTQEETEIRGLFWLKVNKAGKIVEKKLTSFDEEFLIFLKDLERKNLPDPKGSYVEYSLFETIDFHKIENGYILLSEYTAKEYRIGGTHLPGATNVIDTYYWTADLIAMKLDNSGKLIWSRVVPKLQRTVNDGGYFLSVATYCEDDFLHLFFNDNKDNYNQNGEFIPMGKDVEFAKFTGIKNTMAHQTISLSDGTMKRHSLLGKSEAKVIFVPRLSVTYNQNKNLMIYGRGGKKQRLGVISFGK